MVQFLLQGAHDKHPRRIISVELITNPDYCNSEGFTV